MTEYLLLFVGTVLVNNFVLVKFLGLCPFMGVSKKLETAIGMGLATTFVLTLASVCLLDGKQLYLAAAWIGVFTHIGLYSRYRRRGAIYRIGGAQNQPAALSLTGDISAADYH